MSKRGVKSIPLSVDDEDEIKLVEAEYGLKGWATIRKLEQFIGAHGYYVTWDIDAQLLFIREKCLTTVGQSAVSEIVACALRRGVFDAEMFQKQGILTSNRLQETFLTTYKRSKEIVMDKNYALPCVYKFIENVNKNGKSVNIFFKNVCKTAPYNIKLNNIKLNSSSSSNSGLLSAEEYAELCETLGQSDCDYYLERIKAFKAKHPEAVFGVKATILKWSREDKYKQAAPSPSAREKPTQTKEELAAMFDSLDGYEL